MRQIISKEEKDKKAKRNHLIMGLILIVVMALGTVGYAFSERSSGGSSSKIKYNGIEFVKTDNYWNFNLQGQNFVTEYSPEEVKNISFSSNLLLQNYAGNPFYISSDFTAPSAEIARNLNPFVLRVQNACLPEDNCIGNLPNKNCSFDNIIVIKEPKNETEKIYQEENCVFIVSSLENQTRYADAFLFKILGI